jgi:hypothetical protein
MRRRARIVVFGATMVVVISVAILALVLRPRDPATHVLRLRSGRAIEVIDMGLDEAESQMWSLNYRTRVPMNEPRRVACEVASIWNDVREDAERANASKAILMPENFSTHLLFAGWHPAIVSHVSTGYLFVRADTGTWAQHGGPRCVE